MTAVRRLTAFGTEYEIVAGVRTGRFRRNQFYAHRLPDGTWARDVPSARQACEWREARGSEDRTP